MLSLDSCGIPPKAFLLLQVCMQRVEPPDEQYHNLAMLNDAGL